MRRRARIDDNQTEIASAVEAMGASVQFLASVGRGCPDLLVGYCGHNLLWEVKNPLQSPAHQKLTKDQATWHHHWRGSVSVVHSAPEAVRILLDIQARAALGF